MPAIQGLRGSGDWGSDERPTSFREYILWRDPNGQTPLQAIMGKTRSEKVTDPKWTWWEEEQNPLRLELNHGSDPGAGVTTITFVGGCKDVVKGDVFIVEDATFTSAPGAGTNPFETVERLEVSATPSSDTSCSFTRGAAGSTAATITDGSFLTKVGNVFEEGSNSPDTATRNPTSYRNYAQIFKTAFEWTNTAKVTKARTGDIETNDKKRKAFDHAFTMEFAYILGKPYGDDESSTGANNKPKRYTGGLLYYLGEAFKAGHSHCYKVYTGALTEDQFLEDVYKVWDYKTGSSNRGGNERIALAGNGFLNILNKVARNSSSTRIQFDGTVKTYGMELQRWVFPQGTLLVRTMPLFNVHPQFTNSCLILSPGNLINRYLRAQKSEDNLQANDADTKKGQWIGEEGPEFHHMVTMAALMNAQ